MKVTGYVEKVVERPGKYGSMYSIKVDNEFYGTKKNKPQCKEGSYVTFEAEKNDRGYWDADASTIEIAKQDAPTAEAPRTTAWAGADDRQNSIIFQSSRKAALVLVGVLLQNSLLDTGKAKKADAIELVESYVDRYTMRFYEDTKRLLPASMNGKDDIPPGAEEPFKDDIPF